jgi:hypothetical protein
MYGNLDWKPNGSFILISYHVQDYGPSDVIMKGLTNLLLDYTSSFNQLSFKFKLTIGSLRGHFTTFLSILKLSHSFLCSNRNE